MHTVDHRVAVLDGVRDGAQHAVHEPLGRRALQVALGQAPHPQELEHVLVEHVRVLLVRKVPGPVDDLHVELLHELRGPHHALKLDGIVLVPGDEQRGHGHGLALLVHPVERQVPVVVDRAVPVLAPGERVLVRL